MCTFGDAIGPYCSPLRYGKYFVLISVLAVSRHMYVNLAQMLILVDTITTLRSVLLTDFVLVKTTALKIAVVAPTKIRQSYRQDSERVGIEACLTFFGVRCP